MGKLENLESNGIPFHILHTADNHAVVPTYNLKSKNLVDVKLKIPKMEGENLAGQVNTTLHEEMHLIDLFGRKDPEKYNDWFSVCQKSLYKQFDETSLEMSTDIKKLFAEHDKKLMEMQKIILDKYYKDVKILDDAFMNAVHEDFTKDFKEYKKARNKLKSECRNTLDYESCNLMGGGIGNLEDIYDALSGGEAQKIGAVKYGHGVSYYQWQSRRVQETVANFASLSITRPDLIELLRKDKPELVEDLDNYISELLKKVGDKHD